VVAPSKNINKKKGRTL